MEEDASLALKSGRGRRFSNHYKSLLHLFLFSFSLFYLIECLHSLSLCCCVSFSLSIVDLLTLKGDINFWKPYSPPPPPPQPPPPHFGLPAGLSEETKCISPSVLWMPSNNYLEIIPQVPWSHDFVRIHDAWAIFFFSFFYMSMADYCWNDNGMIVDLNYEMKDMSETTFLLSVKLKQNHT